MRQRVVIYECKTECAPLVALLEADGFDLVSCDDGRALMDEIVRHRADVLIYAFPVDSQQDLGMLQLLRRIAPDLPLVLLASEGSLNTQRLVQNLRPIYYSVRPVDAEELREAVLAALSRSSRPNSVMDGGAS